MSVVKFDIAGSNYDIESIIQNYIDDIFAFEKQQEKVNKEKFKMVLNELKSTRTSCHVCGTFFIFDADASDIAICDCMEVVCYSCMRICKGDYCDDIFCKYCDNMTKCKCGTLHCDCCINAFK